MLNTCLNAGVSKPTNKGLFTDMVMVLKRDAAKVRRRKLTAYERATIASAQNWRCNICCALFKALWHIDHIRPLCEGGADAAENMQALCADCHADKTSMESINRNVV